jgi:hypothetical protein
LLAAWIRQARMKSKGQYATRIRRFLRDGGITDPAIVTAETLSDYLAGVQNDGTRHGLISALSAFYPYVTRAAPLAHDPSAQLWERVEEIVKSRKLEQDLLDAGVDVSRARRMRWRDVGVVGMLGGRRPEEIIAPLSSGASTMKSLFGELLANIRELPPEDVEGFLDGPVLLER